MKLFSLRIQGFRRFVDTTVYFSDATFLIGQNNHGKSSTLKALEYLLSVDKKIPLEEFYRVHNSDSEDVTPFPEIVLTAEFRNVPTEAETWHGFRGRIFKYDCDESTKETGLRLIYRKTYSTSKEALVELKSYNRVKDGNLETCQTIEQFRDAGLSEELIAKYFPGEREDKKLSAAKLKALWELDELWTLDESQEIWHANPGGIQQNVLEKLPKFLLIPAQDKTDEITKANGALHVTLNELFALVRDDSSNYKAAQVHLEALARELDPDNPEQEFGKMMGELNGHVSGVFPGSKFIAAASLSDANDVLKPKFDVRMHSNVTTPVHLQGTGMIRSAVFALLRYKQEFEEKRKSNDIYRRPLLIGFEEPEIYLHPNASYQMREQIYKLAQSSRNQIICSTHSPYMIDLSKKPGQVLNRLYLEAHDFQLPELQPFSELAVKSMSFNTTEAFSNLVKNDRDYVKMLIKMDDYVSKVFFSPFVLLVEGDTEEIVLKETILRMPTEAQAFINAHWQIIKARGKPVLISFVRYLKALGIEPYVMHDLDSQTPGAIVSNKPISDAVGNPNRLIVLTDCVEDAIGCKKVTTDKPYNAYKFTSSWGTSWHDIPQSWRTIMEKLFHSAFDYARSGPIRNTIIPKVQSSVNH